MKSSFLLSLAVLVALGGCASNPSADTAPAQAPAQIPAAARGTDETAVDQEMATLGLHKEMRGEAVRELMGEPLSVAPVESPEGKAEIWTFQRTVFVGTRQVQTGMQDMPYFDPFTGAETVKQEPVYGLQSTQAKVEIELLLFNGQVVSWKRKVIGTTNSFE